MNMEDLRTSFLQARGDLAKDTLDSYHHSLQAFVDFSSGRIQSVEEINTDTIVKYTAYLQKDKGCSGTSIQQYVTILKLMLRWADHPIEYLPPAKQGAKTGQTQTHEPMVYGTRRFPVSQLPVSGPS